MTKVLEVVLILFLALISFVLGVKYSKTVREHATWMFENSDEVELPDLSDTENPESDSLPENSKTIEQVRPPAEDQNIVPLVDESDSIELQNNKSDASEIKTQVNQHIKSDQKSDEKIQDKSSKN